MDMDPAELGGVEWVSEFCPVKGSSRELNQSKFFERHIESIQKNLNHIHVFYVCMLHVVMGYSNKTLSCSELNGEHAGECFRSLRHMLTPL